MYLSSSEHAYTIYDDFYGCQKDHYDKTPIQYTVIFHGCKNDYFQMKNCDIFLIFAQNIDRGNKLEPPH